MAVGPTGTHHSLDSYVTATPPQPSPVQNPDPGYVKPARTLQFGPQGSVMPGVAHNWPDSFERP